MKQNFIQKLMMKLYICPRCWQIAIIKAEGNYYCENADCEFGLQEGEILGV